MSGGPNKTSHYKPCMVERHDALVLLDIFGYADLVLDQPASI